MLSKIAFRSFESIFYHFVRGKQTVRNFKIHYSKNSNRPPFLESYVPIYKFPYVRVLSVVNRIKIYPTIFTAIAIPISVGLYFTNNISGEAVVSTSILGATGCLTLYFLGFFANKWIGAIYLHKNEDKVVISFLDFWGRRKDIEVPVSDIFPLSDILPSVTDVLYLKLKRYSTKDVLRLNMNFGKVVDKNKFNKVFLPNVK